MKASIISSILITTLIFTACGGSQNVRLEKQDALQIEKATYQKWVAGIQGGGAGYNLRLEIKENNRNIVLDSIYFDKRVSNLKFSAPNLYSGFINTGKNSAVNHPSGTITLGTENEEVSIPTSLLENEALIVYSEAGKKKYYKIVLSELKSSDPPQ